MTKKRFRDRFPRFGALRKLILNRHSYLFQTGWIESVRRGFPTDAEGRPLPWMCYPIISLLDERLAVSQRLFEYGSGYSTMYFAARVGSVLAVEHVEEWCAHVAERLPDNARVIHRPLDTDGAYCRTILENDDRHDVVVVDGRDRVNCLKHSLERLTPSGVVLLDDSHRPRYAAAHEHAREAGFRSLRLQGLKPRGREIDETTVFYRDGNCLGI